MKRNGPKASCCRITMEIARRVPFRWQHCAGSFAELEADTRHGAVVLRDLGLEKVPPVVILVAKRPKSEEFLLLAGAKPLNAEDTTLYRSVTMRGAQIFSPCTPNQMTADWQHGVTCEIHMRCDSSAARGMSLRHGLEKHSAC